MRGNKEERQKHGGFNVELLLYKCLLHEQGRNNRHCDSRFVIPKADNAGHKYPVQHGARLQEPGRESAPEPEQSGDEMHRLLPQCAAPPVSTIHLPLLC